MLKMPCLISRSGYFTAYFTGGGIKNGEGLPPDEPLPLELRGDFLTGGGIKVGIAFGGTVFFTGGGVNIGGGGSFSFSGGGVNIGGKILLLSGNLGGAKVGGGKKTTGGPFGVESGLTVKAITG